MNKDWQQIKLEIVEPPLMFNMLFKRFVPFPRYKFTCKNHRSPHVWFIWGLEKALEYANMHIQQYHSAPILGPDGNFYAMQGLKLVPWNSREVKQT